LSNTFTTEHTENPEELKIKQQNQILKFDGFVKSPFCPIFVIPAKAGIQLIQAVLSA